jgi:hypothetical protein
MVSARRWDVLAAGALLAWLAVDLTARTLFGSVPWPDSVVDFRLLYEYGRHVLDKHQYPAGYPYPPPAVAAHAATSALPYGPAIALWLALTGLAAVASYAALAGALGLHRRPGLLVALPLAHVAVAYYFQWDMRSLNCNLVVLAALLFGCAALAAGRDRAAGFWFATSVALKVFPVLVLPYLAWVGRWRALAWAAGFSAAWWVGVPLLAFGGGFADVYAGWAGELTRATDPIQKHVHPILISLEKAALYYARGNEAGARALVYAVGALWLALGLWGAAASAGTGGRDPARVFVHVALLVVGPAAVSPYLEAYHLVPLVAPAVVLAAVALDGARPRRARVLAAVGLALAVAVRKVSGAWEARGLWVNVQALILCASALAVLAALAQKPVATEATAPRRGWLQILRALRFARAR